LDVMNFAPEEREAYEEHLKWLRMETSTLKKHETKWFEDGKEEGEQIGIAKGEKKLQEEKKKHLEEKKNMVRMMLQEGIDAQKVSKITGLSEDEIKSL